MSAGFCVKVATTLKECPFVICAVVVRNSAQSLRAGVRMHVCHSVFLFLISLCQKGWLSVKMTRTFGWGKSLCSPESVCIGLIPLLLSSSTKLIDLSPLNLAFCKVWRHKQNVDKFFAKMYNIQSFLSQCLQTLSNSSFEPTPKV
jgi:hypothetical protein